MTTMETFNQAAVTLATITRPLLSHPQASEIGIDVLQWITDTRKALFDAYDRQVNRTLDEVPQ